jgi:hypothetical protein
MHFVKGNQRLKLRAGDLSLSPSNGCWIPAKAAIESIVKKYDLPENIEILQTWHKI